MRATLRRLPLEHVVLVGIAVTVVDVAAGSSWSVDVRSIAGPLRWVLLAGLCTASLAYAVSRTVLSLPSPAAYGFGAALITVACGSIAWSVDPGVSAQRWLSFSTLIVTAGALALAADRNEAVGRILLAVLAGAIAVGLIGLGLLAVNPDEAIQSATRANPARFQGLGQNPNTVAMLFAASMPIAVWVAVTRHGYRRLVALGALALLVGSIVGSGSRAALVAGFVGSSAPILAAFASLWLRAGALAVCIATLALGLAITKIPDSNPGSREVTAPRVTECTRRDAECFLRLQDEVGRPSGGRFEEPKGRSLFGSSGRRQAWEGALEQGADRPVSGYGFGTEGHVFVDRYYAFEGGLPENSFIGIFLQLGAVGAALLCAVLASLAVAAMRVFAPARGETRLLAAACGGVLLVGIGLALFQSYLYAAGNTATLSVWICAFLVTALAGRRTSPS